MTKLQKKPPKYSRNGKYAVAYIHGKKHYLGLYKSPESMTAYARLIAEIRDNPTFDLPKGEPSISVKELVATFLDHAEATLDPTSYSIFRTITMESLLKLYGADTPVDEFKPKALKLVRAEMVASERFCRKVFRVLQSLLLPSGGRVWYCEGESAVAGRRKDSTLDTVSVAAQCRDGSREGWWSGQSAGIAGT